MRRGSRFPLMVVISSVILVAGSVKDIIIRLPASWLVNALRSARKNILRAFVLFYSFPAIFGLSLQWQHQMYPTDSLGGPQMALETI